MSRVKRMERVVALTKHLVDHPYELYPFSFFCEKFGVAKSTLSEDVQVVKNGLASYDMGAVETVAGAAGGVRFIPSHSEDSNMTFLRKLAKRLCEPDRILSGGMIYMNDLLFMPEIAMRLGEIIMQETKDLCPNYIMTVETKGIPLALFVARAYNVPLVVARREARITEGSSVSINYVSGSTRRIQTMSLPKRALPQNAKVLIVDDFLKAGGTARGMQELVQEVGATVVGTGFLISTKSPEKKMLHEYFSLFELNDIDEENKKTELVPVVM